MQYVLSTTPSLDSYSVLAQTAQAISGTDYDTSWTQDLSVPLNLTPGQYYTAAISTTTDGTRYVSHPELHTIVAQQPPVITAPISDIVVPQDRPDGAIVTYTSSVWDAFDPAPVLVSDHPSGSVFPLGITAVTLTATNYLGDQSTKTFRVIVTGNPDVTGFASATLYGSGQGAAYVTHGDFNEDGYEDLVAADYLNKTISVQLNHAGDRTFSSPVPYNVGQGPYRIAVADFNRDGHQDIVVTNYSDSTVSVLLGNGTGGFGAQNVYSVGLNPSAVVVGDFDGNGTPDIAALSSFPNGFGQPSTVTVLLCNGDGTFRTLSPFSTVGGGANGMVVGDFNRDGKLDLAVGTSDSSSDRLRLFMGLGDGTFATGTDYAVPTGVFSLVAGDLNGDGILDLLAVGTYGTPINNDQVALFPGNGDGTLNTPSFFTVGNLPGQAVIGDFNLDGKMDFAVQGSGSLQIFRAKVGGGFENPVSVAAGKATTLVDLDRDGAPDMAGGGTGGAIAVMYNIANAPLTSVQAYAIAGQQGTALSNVAVGHFFDPNVHAQPGDYQVTVQWGDGSTSAGVVQVDPSGGFVITASHGYLDSGNFVTSVAINDQGQTAIATGSAAITHTSPSVAIEASASQIVQGQSVTLSGSVVALSPTASKVAFIDWGDGSTEDFVDLGPGQQNLNLTHQYTSNGTFEIGAYASDYQASASAVQSVTVAPVLPGDYNQNQTVDAADYVLWRKTLGTTGLPAYSGADGSGNGGIGQEDYGVWRANFGQTLPPPVAGSGADSVTASAAPLLRWLNHRSRKPR